MIKKKVFILLLLLSFILVGCNKKEEVVNPEKPKVEENQPEAPASNTEELLTKSEEIQVTSVSKNTIEFKKTDKVKAGDKIAVWIYSKPKFLGYFNVVEENGVKKIEGLEEALKKVKVETGEHNIALVTDQGETIGHIDIYIDETKEVLKEKPPVYTYKEEKVTETISFKTTKKKNANLKKGTTKTIQKGVKGTKEITYKITYDESGKQVSKEKISEEITKKAVDEIIETGTSEFNLKTATITESFFGVACPVRDSKVHEGQIFCGDGSSTSNDFSAISIGNVHFVTKFYGDSFKPLKVTKINDALYKGTYNGMDYYFEARGGAGENEKLTPAKCKELNITCGTW